MIISNIDGVCVVENFISSSEISIINKFIEHADFIEAPAVNSYYVHMDKDTQKIVQDANSRIASIIEGQYKCVVHDEECATINKYIPGWFLEEHDDTGYTNSGRVSTDFSSIVYFNSDFIGGNLHFIGKNITIKPEAGMLVVSPATQDFLHKVTILEDGFRYTATTFWQEKV